MIGGEWSGQKILTDKGNTYKKSGGERIKLESTDIRIGRRGQIDTRTEEDIIETVMGKEKKEGEERKTAEINMIDVMEENESNDLIGQCCLMKCLLRSHLSKSDNINTKSLKMAWSY